MSYLAQNPFGTVQAPPGVQPLQQGGLGKFLNNMMLLLIAGAGIYALFNFILAGYSFLSANGDSKKVEAAWAKIWQSVLGLVVAAGAFVLAAIFGRIIFGSWGALLNPQLIPLR